jgi:hypothetical protein
VLWVKDAGPTGGTTGVVDTGAVRGAGGVIGATWGVVKVISTVRGTADVSEAGGDKAVKCLAV